VPAYNKGSSGNYSFLANPSTTYTIGEVFANADWHNTTPVSGTVAVGTTGDFAGPNFGNVCVGPNSGALTIGYWANHPETASDMSLLNGITLVDLKGKKVTPFASVAVFQSWLQNASAKNMAYMLSAQLAGMALNVNHGLVSSSQIVYAPGTTSGGATGFTTVGALMNEAKASIIANPLTTTAGTIRSYQQSLKNALDNANNNLNFVEPTLEDCTFTTPY
jgi:hypothetical protein